MEQQQLAQVDALCEKLYTSTVLAERRQAEENLAAFATTDGIDRCRFVLEYSTSPYSQHMATSSLKKIITGHWPAISGEKRQETRLYLLNFMASKGSGLVPFVKTSLITLLSTIIKLGWQESEENKEVVGQLLQYVNTSLEHCLLGLQILDALVVEMNVVLPHKSLSGHRKVSISFRNSWLLNIFNQSCQTLTSLLQGQLQGTPEQLQQLCDSALKLSHSCLSYDFIGTNMDDCSEEVGTVQIPTNWRDTVEDGAKLRLFFDIYSQIDVPSTSRALQCLVQLASVRQSLFTGETERQAYLSCLISNTTSIMRAQTGLSDPQKFHEFCRLLNRLKTNFQISMLVKSEGYQDWIGLTANLTISSFNSWQWNNNSIFYLLSLWSRLVASMPYLKGDHLTYLDTYVPRITEAYITARIQSVQTVLQSPDQVDDPLDNEDQVLQELESLAPLCKFNYSQVGSFLFEKMQDVTPKYTEAVQQYNANPSQDLLNHIQLYEGQLSWFIYIIGMPGGQSGTESHELMDGQLAGSVFQFIMADNNAAQRQQFGRPCIDLAIAAFLGNFRKKHIGDQMMSASKVYKKLRELVGLTDHLMVMNIIVNRVVTNCKVWAADEDVIRRTLELLSELASGYSSGKQLLKLEGIHFIFQNHSSEHFPFLLEPCNTRHRTTFYKTLARLLFLDENVVPHFEQFVAPITRMFQALASVSPDMWQQDAQRTLIGLFRDVRGIVSACVTRRSYMMVFDWLYPAHFPVFVSAAERCYGNPQVTTALLKCLCELTHNRTQRMTFDPSSPNGILLFRETSKILVAYANGILSTTVQNDVYAEKYKGMGVCFQITMRVMAGNYVNFGVFELYGDKALSNALGAIIKLFLSIPLEELIAYPKISMSCFQMLEVLFRNHTQAMMELEGPVFVQIANALQQGLRSPKTQISTQCAGALDHICAYIFRLMGKDTPQAQRVSQHMQTNPDIFPSFINLIFNMVMFDDITNQWSMSRPLLALILINENYFNTWKTQMINSQNPSHQAQLKQAFEELMNEVNRNLEARNRDKFTTNLTIFRQTIKLFM